MFKGTDFPTELRKYNIGRSNLILIAVLTAINIFLLATKDYTYFYFSAAIPYIITDLAMFYTGMYPEEFYSEYLQDATFLPPIIFALALFISVAIIAVYILCFIMSGKQRKGFLICGLVLFAKETRVMFAYYSFDATMLVDFAFHIWGIVSISIGLSAHSKMKNLPAEEFFAPPAEDPEAEESDSATPMRPCDHIEDENVLIKYDLFGSEVIYLKTKKAYQLIIDGQIYCEIISRLQKKNNMTARFKGYTVEVGYNGLFYYVSVNGNIIYRKAKLN